MLKNTVKTWGSVTRTLHWVSAILIMGMIGYGWWMNHIPERSDRYFYRSIHADIGYVVLLLLVVRLAWRLMNPTPALPADTPPAGRWVARAVQGALYLVTFGVAMLGWAHSGASARPYTSWFGLFNVPQFTATDKAAAHAYEDNHILGAYILLALIAVHVLAALYRHFYKRDRVLNRMVSGETI